MENIEEVREIFNPLSAEEIIQNVAEFFGQDSVFSSSLGLEDQVITYMIADKNLNIPIFFIDTGRHFQETYDVLQMTVSRYKTKVLSYHPDNEDVEELLNNHGPNSFYNSVENRQHCCHIRKVKPLKRALTGKVCWITGIRKEQSQNRTNMEKVEWDDKNQIVKIHPLFDWDLKKVQHYIAKNDIPINTLHKENFPSVGCAPCTRAVKPGEDLRAGRWWWENDEAQECGLHFIKKEGESS